MNTKSKGNRNEHRSIAILEAAGYRCTRAAASLGVFDIVGIGSTDVVLVQVKTRDWPGSVESEAIRMFLALLCVYLVFKAVEILQIGLMTSNPERAALGKTIGTVAVVASVLVAAAFVYWIDSQAQSLSENMMRSAPGLTPGR